MALLDDITVDLTMSERKTVELTREQQSLLLEGLSYLRSSALLEMRFPSEEADRERESQLQTIQDLADHISGSQTSREPVSV